MALGDEMKDQDLRDALKLIELLDGTERMGMPVSMVLELNSGSGNVGQVKMDQHGVSEVTKLAYKVGKPLVEQLLKDLTIAMKTELANTLKAKADTLMNEIKVEAPLPDVNVYVGNPSGDLP
jgi:hypothetical protein